MDIFTKNIIIVFAGASLVNFFNLLYQLLIAHKLTASEFAAFNSLLSIFVVISSPLTTLQLAVAKYSAEFNAHNQIAKIKFLFSDLFKKTSILAISTFLIFWLASVYILNTLKITSVSCGYILAGLLALSWINPVFSGGIQGLELFAWMSSVSVISGSLKLGLAFMLIILGYNIAGALAALLIPNLISLVVSYFLLRRFICLKLKKEDIEYKQILTYLFPLALSSFCFMALVNLDMLLVRRFFSIEESGLYSLAQMLGKVFLFLPGAINVVIFPRTSGLKAKNLDTLSTLKRGLLYCLGLCILAILFYNLFPGLVLKVMTGKVYPESIFLGRLFAISMSFFTLSSILIFYFLSIKDLRFIKYLVGAVLLESLAIVFFHHSLIQVQITLCLNSILVFFTFLFLALKNRGL